MSTKVTGAAIDNPFGDTNVAIYKRLIQLNDAQIKALPSAPLEVIPPPGENKIVILVNAVLYCYPIIDVYTNIGEGTNAGLLLVYGSDWNGDASIIYKPLYNVFINEQILLFTQIFDNLKVAPIINSSSINSGIFLFANNIDGGLLGNFTGGNVDNKASLTSTYYIVDL